MNLIPKYSGPKSLLTFLNVSKGWKERGNASLVSSEICLSVAPDSDSDSDRERERLEGE